MSNLKNGMFFKLPYCTCQRHPKSLNLNCDRKGTVMSADNPLLLSRVKGQHPPPQPPNICKIHLFVFFI